MAESESGADKSEEPTSKRLEEARQKGQIARSKELGTLAPKPDYVPRILGVVAVGFDQFGPGDILLST